MPLKMNRAPTVLRLPLKSGLKAPMPKVSSQSREDTVAPLPTAVIAFEFATWISAEFKFYFIKEFQRLKADENDRLKLEWNLQRTLAKVNYHIHTDAIKEKLIPAALPKEKINFVYADEADMLNMALFGMTAKQWREANPKTEGNIRDAATLEQLVVLSNMESINSVLIHQGLKQSERLQQLNGIAITQMKSLLQYSHLKKLK
jgi:hypothetical protein